MEYELSHVKFLETLSIRYVLGTTTQTTWVLYTAAGRAVHIHHSGKIMGRYLVP
jgi:hypothetical protein